MSEAKQVSFGGLEGTLKFRASQMIEFENVMGGKGLFEVLEHGLNFKALCVLLRIGLSHANKRLTVVNVQEAVDAYMEGKGDILTLWHDVQDALAEGGVYGAAAQGKA